MYKIRDRWIHLFVPILLGHDISVMKILGMS